MFSFFAFSCSRKWAISLANLPKIIFCSFTALPLFLNFNYFFIVDLFFFPRWTFSKMALLLCALSMMMVSIIIGSSATLGELTTLSGWQRLSVWLAYLNPRCGFFVCQQSLWIWCLGYLRMFNEECLSFRVIQFKIKLLQANRFC